MAYFIGGLNECGLSRCTEISAVVIYMMRPLQPYGHTSHTSHTSLPDTLAGFAFNFENFREMQSGEPDGEACSFLILISALRRRKPWLSCF